MKMEDWKKVWKFKQDFKNKADSFQAEYIIDKNFHKINDLNKINYFGFINGNSYQRINSIQLNVKVGNEFKILKID